MLSLEIVKIAGGLFSLYLFLVLGNLQKKFIITQFYYPEAVALRKLSFVPQKKTHSSHSDSVA